MASCRKEKRYSMAGKKRNALLLILVYITLYKIARDRNNYGCASPFCTREGHHEQVTPAWLTQQGAEGRSFQCERRAGVMGRALPCVRGRGGLA